jgi:hypothetical protein
MPSCFVLRYERVWDQPQYNQDSKMRHKSRQRDHPTQRDDTHTKLTTRHTLEMDEGAALPSPRSTTRPPPTHSTNLHDRSVD